MGCVSSKHISKEIKQEKLLRNLENYTHHVVSLTSSTYGVLELDKKKEIHPPEHKQVPESKQSIKTSPLRVKRSSFQRESPEIINAWELMQGLEDEIGSSFGRSRKSPNSRAFLRGLTEIDARSPLKFFNQISSPGKLKKKGGKENKGIVNCIGSSENSPTMVLKDRNDNKSKGSAKKPSPKLWASFKGSPRNVKGCEISRLDRSEVVVSSRRSFGPLFDPELVASFEKEISEEEEEIKKMISFSSARISRRFGNPHDSDNFLESYKKKCPPGGQDAIIIYTTTLRGIRKTFEDCNVARSIIESHNVRMIERDISMDSGFKEELRELMGSKEVRVPLVFVKGRLIGGANEMLRLDEEGKFGILIDGIERAGPVGGCRGCFGIRFVMCCECNGSCKLLGDDGKRSLKCGKCNENGLIHCPICC